MFKMVTLLLAFVAQWLDPLSTSSTLAHTYQTGGWVRKLILKLI